MFIQRCSILTAILMAIGISGIHADDLPNSVDAPVATAAAAAAVDYVPKIVSTTESVPDMCPCIPREYCPSTYEMKVEVSLKCPVTI